MDFSLSEEQEMLKKSARDFLTNECPKTLVREMAKDERGYTSELWRKMANLGWMYQNGFGVERDYIEAMKLYLKAVDDGNAFAMCNIGVLYQNGFGVKTDYAEARKWYEKAAEVGNSGAMGNLGSLYQNGLGVERSPATAKQWYEKAAKSGYVPARSAPGEQKP